MKLRRPFVIGEKRENRLQVLSSGGGTQSNCMIVLIAMGLLPKPDLIVMADTERELSKVFDYQKKYIQPICDEIGIEYVIIKKSDWTDADIKFNDDSDTHLPPFYTTLNGRHDGLAGKSPGFCSDKWKTVPIHRYLNNRYGQLELTRKGVDFWIGMSFDEPTRVNYPTGKWQRRYPLFEAMIIREQAIKIVQEYGLPEPPRSACWMCPNRPTKGWKAMKEYDPGDFAKAVAFEKELKKEFDFLWLHNIGVPIGEIDFDEIIGTEEQLDMFANHCDTGMCFV